jgi:hypothetical protein
MENRTTSEKITSLNKNEIFVFGSNLSGRHGAGAARLALMKFGAYYGEGYGLQGKSYAIPTKDKELKTLSIEKIKPYVDEFISFAKQNKNLTFLVTEVGCGLANHKPEDIAPLFKECADIENIHLPIRFWNVINNN